MRAILFNSNGESAASLARESQAWRSSSTNEASLFVASAHDEAEVRGAFQREGAELQRGSGGGTVIVGPGRVWLSLALSRSDLFIPDASPDKILNRYVRPLLRVLTKVSSTPVSYFGRDWISAKGRPVGFVGFGHDASTGRALFEAVIAVSAPFAHSSPSFMGKNPASLSELAGRSIADSHVIDALVSAYSFGNEFKPGTGTGTFTGVTDRVGSPLASCDTAMGTLRVYVDSGRLLLGGELMASSDAIERLENAINSPSSDLDGAVDSALTSSGAVVFGIRSLASVRDLILSARTSLEGRSNR
jgi:hypothetical protein